MKFIIIKDNIYNPTPTIMLIGDTNTAKTTTVNTLLKIYINDNFNFYDVVDQIKQKIQLFFVLINQNI